MTETIKPKKYCNPVVFQYGLDYVTKCDRVWYLSEPIRQFSDGRPVAFQDLDFINYRLQVSEDQSMTLEINGSQTPLEINAPGVVRYAALVRTGIEQLVYLTTVPEVWITDKKLVNVDPWSISIMQPSE